MQNRRVHKHDVRHGHERRDPGHNFSAPRGSQLLKLEIPFRFADQDLFTIADVPKPDSLAVLARCRELAAVSEMTGGTLRTFLSPAMRRCYTIVGAMDAIRRHDRAALTRRAICAPPSLDEPGKRVFVIGSHLDTVRDAGAFDGILGVTWPSPSPGITLPTNCPLTSKSSAFPKKKASALASPLSAARPSSAQLDEETLTRVDADGITVAQAIRDFGLDPAVSRRHVSRKPPPLGFLEFHIEQGPVLDNAGESVGIVEAIAGQTRAVVKFTGSANHAGTTPMRLRRDALAASAQWILAVEELPKPPRLWSPPTAKSKCSRM